MDKFVETESVLVVAECYRDSGDGEWLLIGIEFLLEMMKMF